MLEGTIEIILLGLIVAIPILLKIYEPKIKGKIGETKVSLLLRSLPSSQYKVLNDILIKNKSRSSQIDHIVVSTAGVFVIETKNYKGWIFGHEKSDNWTQVIFKQKFKLRNPINQAWGHINTLKTVLSDFEEIQYFPVVVFTGSATLKKITSTVPVIKTFGLLRYISRISKTKYLSSIEIDEIYGKLQQQNRVDRASRKTHVRKAKMNRRFMRNPSTCPKCGGKLSPRNGRYGKFYGCQNYPECSYTKNYYV